MIVDIVAIIKSIEEHLIMVHLEYHLGGMRGQPNYGCPTTIS